MNLYKLSQSTNNDYDTYDSCVVCAENEHEAKTIHPSSFAKEDWFLRVDEWRSNTWATCLEDVKCELIGVSSENIKPGLVLASFNAG